MDTINLQLFAVKYDNDTDYQALINKAVAENDYAAAARYEQQRNAKIADLDASGTNKYGVTQTTNYAQHLGSGYQSTGNYHDAGLSPEAQAAINDAKTQYYNAMSLNDKDGMAAAHEAAERIREQAGYRGGTDGSEYIALGVGGTAAPVFNYDMSSKPTFNSQYGSRIDQMLNELLNRDSFSYNVAAPTYTDNYSGKINTLVGEIENRDPFSYDAATDPTFQQYKAQYQREGNRAMNDAMASAAAHAGGMNSYAMTAAQQANDYYSAQLNDKIPELAQLAYEMYMRDFDQDVAELNLYRGLGETEYNRYRDEYNDYLNERNTAYQMYLDDIEKQITELGLVQDMDATQYNRYRDTMSDWRNDLNFAYGQYRDQMGDYQWRTEFDYSKERDEVADDQWQQSFDHTVDQDNIGNDIAYGQLTGTIPSTGQSTLGKQEFDYGKERDEIEDGRYENETAYGRAMDLLSSGVGFDSVVGLLVDAGFTQAQASEIVGDVQASLNNNGGGNDDTGGTVNGKDDDGYTDPKFNGNGGLTYAQVKELQEYYGVEADGKWGEASRAAANGWSADKAWESYQAAKKMPDIQGKDFIEYESAASNYAEVRDMCEKLYKAGDKEGVFNLLREARETGALNFNDYSSLFNAYRNK